MRRTTIRLAIAAAMVALAGVKLVAALPFTPAQTSKPAVATAKVSSIKPKAAKAKTTKKKTTRKASKAPVVNAKGSPSLTAPPVNAGPWKPSNPVAQELSSKSDEVARARRVLPAGTDLNAATAGFRNYSQFAAAINATERKNLDFARLKALMTGVNMDGSRTHRPTMTLSEATQALHGTATTPPGS
jgi:hypothetical protein